VKVILVTVQIDLAVFVDRNRQTATTDYSVSGTTLTFTRAPHNNAEIFVRHIKKNIKMKQVTPINNISLKMVEIIIN
jgi:hypothetical protein